MVGECGTKNFKKKVREKTWNTWNLWIMWVNSLISKHFSALKNVDQTWINVKQDVEHAGRLGTRCDPFLGDFIRTGIYCDNCHIA